MRKLVQVSTEILLKIEKLGRVGQKYGAEKKDVKTDAESKKKREIIGQAKSVMEALAGTNSKYNNPNKVKLDVTPKGNWRVFYNGKDTGVTIGQSVISDSVVEKMGWERHSAK